MSILIKGLSLKDVPDDEYMVVRIWKDGSISTVACSYGVNHGEKRAVEVPTPHGRLIDADALITTFCEWGVLLERGQKLTITMCEAKQAIIDIIEDAPTVIEAEGE